MQINYPLQPISSVDSAAPRCEDCSRGALPYESLGVRHSPGLSPQASHLDDIHVTCHAVNVGVLDNYIIHHYPLVGDSLCILVDISMYIVSLNYFRGRILLFYDPVENMPILNVGPSSLVYCWPL